MGKIRRPLTKKEQAQIVIESLAKNLCVLAYHDLRLMAALEWATDEQIEAALLLMPIAIAEKVRLIQARGC